MVPTINDNINTFGPGDGVNPDNRQQVRVPPCEVYENKTLPGHTNRILPGLERKMPHNHHTTVYTPRNHPVYYYSLYCSNFGN